MPPPHDSHPPHEPHAPGTAHESGEHAHAGEQFPRLTTAELVGQAEAERVQRASWVPWLLGAGLGALVLGLPSERLWGQMRVVPEDALGHAALGRCVRALAGLIGTSTERAWFLTSAVALALCVPALAALFQRLGAPGRRQLLVGASVLLSPLVLVSARLPLAYVPGLLGAILVVESLMQRALPRGTKAWRAGACLLLAGWLHPQNFLLAPAVALDVSRTPTGAREARLFQKASWVLCALLGLLLNLLLPLAEAPAWARAGGRVLLGGGGGGPGAMLVAAAIMALGLGTLLPWLFTLFFGQRAAEESPAPRWVYLAGAAALVPWIAGSPQAGPVAPWLPVLAALGGIDRAVRNEEDERRLLARAWVQLALALLLLWAFDATDPDRDWRRRARHFLEADDVVLTMRADHAYLLKERWGLEPWQVPPQVREDELPTVLERPQPAVRVVLDGDLRSFPSALRARASAWAAQSLPDEAPSRAVHEDR